MPLYEYRCLSCGNLVEIIQKFSDDPLSTCDSCGGELERLLSPPAIQFKGHGWYVTDYAHKNGAPRHKKEEKDSANSSETGSKKESGDTSDKD